MLWLRLVNAVYSATMYQSVVWLNPWYSFKIDLLYLQIKPMKTHNYIKIAVMSQNYELKKTPAATSFGLIVTSPKSARLNKILTVLTVCSLVTS